MKNNNSFSLFARITRPQFSLQHPVQLVFPLIIINRGCKSNPSSVWANLTLLGTHLIRQRPWGIRSQGKADKIRLFDHIFNATNWKKKKKKTELANPSAAITWHWKKNRFGDVTGFHLIRVLNTKGQKPFLYSWGLLPFKKDGKVTAPAFIAHAQLLTATSRAISSFSVGKTW